MKRIRKWLLFLWGVAVVALGLVMFFQFFPQNRFEFELPAEVEGRLFARNLGSPDGDMPVYVSDWPHTLTSPLNLGSIGFSSSDQFYLSADKTLIVCKSSRHDGHELNIAAYDFKLHERITPIERGMSLQEYNEFLLRHVADRGGSSPQNLPIPDVKR